MHTDIDDIWDLPVETSTRHPPVDNPNSEGPTSTATPHPSNHPLFLPSDDEEDAPAVTRSEPNTNPDIDALFEGLEDIDEGLAPALDLDALRREADTRNARAVRAELATIIPTAELSAAAATASDNRGKKGPLGDIDGDGEDEEDGGKKKRKPIPKLDEARLLGKNGLPQLIKDTNNFKPKGKGHEATDLDRVLQVYQFWSHKLYPKTRFKETVDRVEKLCHSKRMQVALSVWRDEAHGLVNGVRPTPEDDDNDSDVDSDADAGAQRGVEAVAGAAVAEVERGDASLSQPSSSDRPRGVGVSATSDSEGDSDGMPLSSEASHPPSSSPDRDNAAIELDALLEEEEALRASSTHVAPTGHAWRASNSDAVAMDEDEDLWDILDTSAPAAAPAMALAPAAMDDDEDMWDIVHEIEQEKAKEVLHQPNPAPEPPAAVDAQVDDLDDLYL